MITQEEIKKIIHYDSNTGIITSKINRGTAKKGKILGGVIKNHSGKSYSRIVINEKTYRTHRIIWLYVNGIWPNQIDHIDGNGLNNKLANLRSVNSHENNKNQRLYKTNKSGICGVCWYKKNSKWLVQIGMLNENIPLGYFDDFFEACCARKSAENKYEFHINHGTVRSL